MKALCPHCGKVLSVADSLAGKVGRCPHCQRTFWIARPEEQPARQPEGPVTAHRPERGEEASRTEESARLVEEYRKAAQPRLRRGGRIKMRYLGVRLSKEVQSLRKAIDDQLEKLGILVLEHEPEGIETRDERQRLTDLQKRLADSEVTLKSLTASGAAASLRRKLAEEEAALREDQRREMISVGGKAESARARMPGADAHYTAIDRLRAMLAEREQELAEVEKQIGPVASLVTRRGVETHVSRFGSAALFGIALLCFFFRFSVVVLDLPESLLERLDAPVLPEMGVTGFELVFMSTPSDAKKLARMMDMDVEDLREEGERAFKRLGIGGAESWARSEHLPAQLLIAAVLAGIVAGLLKGERARLASLSAAIACLVFLLLIARGMDWGLDILKEGAPRELAEAITVHFGAGAWMVLLMSVAALGLNGYLIVREPPSFVRALPAVVPAFLLLALAATAPVYLPAIFRASARSKLRAQYRQCVQAVEKNLSSEGDWKAAREALSAAEDVAGKLRKLGERPEELDRLREQVYAARRKAFLRPSRRTVPPSAPSRRPPPVEVKPEPARTVRIPPDVQAGARLEAGGALLELFKADSIDRLPEAPLTRKLWYADLACSDAFVLPGQEEIIGVRQKYVARYSFVFRAEKAGKYSFTLIPGRNECKLAVGGRDVTQAGRGATAQGVCELQKGYYSVRLLVASSVPERYWSSRGSYARFEVKLLAPGAMEAVRIGKDMMLFDRRLRAQLPRPRPAARQDVAAYERGAALLEVFKSASMDAVPELPVLRNLWQGDLACAGTFPVSGKAGTIGEGEAYVARYTFYFHARRPGRYSFSLLPGRNTCKLVVGGLVLARAKDRVPGQGICELDEGVYPVELWVASKVPPRWGGREDARFEVKVLAPGAMGAVRVGKELMLFDRRMRARLPRPKKAPVQQVAAYESGGGMLEMYRTDSMDRLPEAPTARGPWRFDLRCRDWFVEKRYLRRFSEGNDYVARISFFLEAKTAGRYGFQVIPGNNSCRLTVGGLEVLAAEKGTPAQGVCELEKGVYEVVFWLASQVPRNLRYRPRRPSGRGVSDARFDVLILKPGAMDAVRLTKDMMLVRGKGPPPPTSPEVISLIARADKAVVAEQYAEARSLYEKAAAIEGRGGQAEHKIESLRRLAVRLYNKAKFQERQPDGKKRLFEAVCAILSAGDPAPYPNYLKKARAELKVLLEE